MGDSSIETISNERSYVKAYLRKNSMKMAKASDRWLVPRPRVDALAK
jgi:hypothetical protein